MRRAHLEIFGRQMEADGRMRSTVARRLSTLGSIYRYCHVEGIILERNPAANVRRPKVDAVSRTLGLDRNELGALLVQAGLGSERDHALISLLRLERATDQRGTRCRCRIDRHDRGHRSALLLAEQLDVALFTASDEVDSNRIEIVRPW